MKIRSKAIILGAFAVAGSCLLLANGKKAVNSVLDGPGAPIVRTAYTETIGQPIDFEKAASAAVPSMVHVKTTTKFKQVAGRGNRAQGQDPFGDMPGGDLFKRFFGDGSGEEGQGRQFSMPDQRASGSG